MKKHVYAFLAASVVLLVLTLTFISCSQKKEAAVENPDTRPKQFIFEQLLEGKTSQSFESLMLRPVLEQNKMLYLFEKMYPECSGIYDLTALYSEACDNGSWVDNLLFSIEEARMGDELLSLLEDEEGILPPIDFTEQENEIAALETSVEKLLADSYGRLKIMTFGNEYFYPDAKEDSQTFVHYSNNNAIRAFYDKLFRLVKKEYWKMNSVEDSKITATETYEYNGDAKTPVRKIIENEASKIVSNLDENGLVIKAEKFSISSKEEENNKNNLPENITEWQYDSKQRITAQTVTDYEYTASGKLKKKTIKKQLFDYTKVGESDLPPDYEYYEDGMLRRKTEYTTKDEYSTLVVFDGNNSVKTYYKDYVKTKELYITDGVERRVKNYE